jgi:hypothetical protein
VGPDDASRVVHYLFLTCGRLVLLTVSAMLAAAGGTAFWFSALRWLPRCLEHDEIYANNNSEMFETLKILLTYGSSRAPQRHRPFRATSL